LNTSIVLAELPVLSGAPYLLPLLRCNSLELSPGMIFVTPFFGSQALAASAIFTTLNTTLKKLELFRRMREVTLSLLGIPTIRTAITPRLR
jgi:hypothetical protein